MNSYQKLKEENKRLKKEIFTLVEDKDFLEVVKIKSVYKMQIELEKSIWSGSPLRGLINSVNS